MATKKSKTSKKAPKATSTKPKTATKTAKKTELEAIKTNKVENKPTNSKGFLKGFFARKYEEKESILTIFKNHKFYGSLLGEILGTMILALLLIVVYYFQYS